MILLLLVFKDISSLHHDFSKKVSTVREMPHPLNVQSTHSLLCLGYWRCAVLNRLGSKAYGRIAHRWQK